MSTKVYVDNKLCDNMALEKLIKAANYNNETKP